MSELGKTDQVVRLRQLLEGLGNAGHPKTVNAVKPFLNHPHVLVKVAAFHSLRLNHSVEATRAYVDALVERGHPRYIRNRVMPLVGHMKMTRNS